MLVLDIPGFGALRLADLVCDFNGTLARDGRLVPGVAEALGGLAAGLRIHVVTADTHGGAAAALAGLPVALHVLPPGDQALAKRALVQRLGREGVVAIGNGRNDREMLAAAALGVAVLGPEGAAAPALLAADVVVKGPLDALGLLATPLRLVATLRD